MSCPRSSFNNFSDSGLFVLSGAKDLYVPNYQTVGAIFARWLSIKMTATATFLETFFCKELLGHDTRSPDSNTFMARPLQILSGDRPSIVRKIPFVSRKSVQPRMKRTQIL